MISARRHYYLSCAIMEEPGGQGQARESLSSGTWEAQNCGITEIADPPAPWKAWHSRPSEYSLLLMNILEWRTC